MSRRRLLTSMRKDDIYILAITMVLVGLLCVAVLRIPPAVPAEESASGQLIELIRTMEAENTGLEDEIAALLKQGEGYTVDGSSDDDLLTEASRANGEARAAAGLTELKGKGVTLVLNDNTEGARKAQQEDPTGYNAEEFIVHDLNLLYLVNDLRPYADGIAINGQRIVTNSTIRCVGTVILVNQTRMAPPYRLEIVGDSDKLLKAIEASGTYQTLKASNIEIEAAAAATLTLPAYTGIVTREHSTVVDDTEEE